jgi:hypothetical protein
MALESIFASDNLESAVVGIEPDFPPNRPGTTGCRGLVGFPFIARRNGIASSELPLECAPPLEEDAGPRGVEYEHLHCFPPYGRQRAECACHCCKLVNELGEIIERQKRITERAILLKYPQ